MRLLLVGALLVIASQAHSQITFTDGMFLDADWTTTVFTLNHPSTGGSSAHVAAGGNLAEHRSITSLTCSGGGNPCKLMVVEIKPTAQYDPSSQGEIASLSYAEDQKCASVDGCVGGGQVWLPALQQGGKFYVHTGGNTAILNAWTSVAASGLTAVDFAEVLLTAGGIGDPGSNPDFSGSGSLIQFGYARANSLSSQRTGRIDNWSFTVHLPTVAVEEVPWGMVKRSYR